PLPFQVKALTLFSFSSPPRAFTALSTMALALSSARAEPARPPAKTIKHNALGNRVMRLPHPVRWKWRTQTVCVHPTGYLQGANQARAIGLLTGSVKKAQLQICRVGLCPESNTLKCSPASRTVCDTCGPAGHWPRGRLGVTLPCHQSATHGPRAGRYCPDDRAACFCVLPRCRPWDACRP